MSTPLHGVRSALKPAQEAALAALEEGGLSELTRAKYEEIGGVSRSQAAYDLADLVTLGILERVGTGRSTRYRLPGARPDRQKVSRRAPAPKKRTKRTPTGGRPRKWTDERIRTGLADFCAQRGHWPRASEFRDAGKTDLYLAASRYGGIDRWAAELGLQEKKSWRLHLRAPGLRWPRLSVGALATVALIVVIGLAGVLLDRGLWRLNSAESPATVSGRQNGTAGGAPSDSSPQSKSVSRDEHALGSRAASVAVERPSRPMFADLRLVARFGSSWLAVRRWSPTGETVYEGTLAKGRSLRFSGKQLWLRLGAPHNLTGRLGSRSVDLPEQTSTILVTRRGLRVIDTPEPFTPPPPAVVLDSPVTLASAEPSTSSEAPVTPSEPSPEPAPPPSQAPSPDPKP